MYEGEGHRWNKTPPDTDTMYLVHWCLEYIDLFM